MHIAQLGDRVRIQFCRVPERVAAPGGDKTQKTAEFTVGGREVFASLSLGILGMAPGDRKRITVQPEEAYGNIKPKLIRRVSRAKFPKHLSLHVGKRLMATRGVAGRRHRVTVIELSPTSITVDGNHPLAGQTIELEVYLVSLDSSCNANKDKQQFDVGGES